MKIIFTFLLACFIFSDSTHASSTLLIPDSDELRRPPLSTSASSAVDLVEAARISGLTLVEAREVRNILSEDFKNGVKDTVRTRWFFRKIANCTEAFGNTLLYFGSGASAIAAAGSLIFPGAVPYILFAGASCFAAHVTLIGVAKCSSREAGERECQLVDLAHRVGFEITHLQPTVTDDAVAGSHV